MITTLLDDVLPLKERGVKPPMICQNDSLTGDTAKDPITSISIKAASIKTPLYRPKQGVLAEYLIALNDFKVLDVIYRLL